MNERINLRTTRIVLAKSTSGLILNFNEIVLATIIFCLFTTIIRIFTKVDPMQWPNVLNFFSNENLNEFILNFVRFLRISGMVSPLCGKAQNIWCMAKKCSTIFSDSRRIRRLCLESTHNVIKFIATSAENTKHERDELKRKQLRWKCLNEINVLFPFLFSNLPNAGVKTDILYSAEWRSSRNEYVSDG